MKIKDREEFEDAQAMARIAVERTNNSIPAEAFLQKHSGTQQCRI